uniref:tRNA(His) guanylyltransferase n=1 Tax=Polytomella parva TaxID=51329 RepID=A0A7S0URY5_9CHLO|mmetsp:Transcript_19324/g.34896  ORF Transcript_19324/g.34896 Transcript_19324/m.34896 type:complete len:261 (+) Transcript_19324:129-911(+)
MANSKYEYVKKFEVPDPLLPSCWIVVRIDGKGFTKFSDIHDFEKPNDKRALDLMDACASELMKEFADIRLAYGESDEYSFVLDKDATLYGRRSSKIVSVLTSCFSSNYVRLWQRYMGNTDLKLTPMFDGRAVLYPNAKIVRDYLAWRQADTHINNQYNTCFWALVKSGKAPQEAQQILKGTLADFKNELLFTQFGINYSNLPEQFKKGTTIIRRKEPEVVKILPNGDPVERMRTKPQILFCDIIGDKFWEDYPEILGGQD